MSGIVWESEMSGIVWESEMSGIVWESEVSGIVWESERYPALCGNQRCLIGRNAATLVRLNPGSSTDQFDCEGRKIKGNRKKTPRKCPFQGRNRKVTTPEEGRGKEKVETCSVAVPSEVGFFFWGGGGVQ